MSQIKVIFSEHDVPEGFVPMADYAHQGQLVYSRVKRASRSGKVATLALLQDGQFRERPRKYVNAAEIKAFLNRCDRQLGGEPPVTQPATIHVDDLATEIRSLHHAVEMLAIAVDGLSQPSNAPAAC